MKRLIKKVSEETLKKVLTRFKINPNTAIGQHFLTDESSLDIILKHILKDSLVIETGAGLGQLTQKIANKAKKVIAIEIDPSFRGILSHIKSKHRNLEIIFNDVLSLNFNELMEDGYNTQIIASLPFHISEPFLFKISFLKLTNAILVVGKSLEEEITGIVFGKLTFLTQTLFRIDVLEEISKDKFFPIPRTDTAIIKLTPRQKHEFKDTLYYFIARDLLTKKSLIKNVIKESLIQFSKLKQSAKEKYLTQNQARKIIQTMNIDEIILNKNFNQLNNENIQTINDKLKTVRILP